MTAMMLNDVRDLTIGEIDQVSGGDGIWSTAGRWGGRISTVFMVVDGVKWYFHQLEKYPSENVYVG